MDELLNQRVHILASTQELSNSTRSFVKILGDYLGEEIPIYLSMGTWPCHIYRFERKYKKAFAKDPLFGEDFMDIIHKHVQVFLHSYTKTSIKDVESGSLVEFGDCKRRWREESG